VIGWMRAAICGACPPPSTDGQPPRTFVRPLLERRSIKLTRSAAAPYVLSSTAGMIVSRPDVMGSGGPGDEPIPIGRDAIAWAARSLRQYEMPPNEISAVLEADNPELVRRYMELHRERLQERLADRLRALIGLERLLLHVIHARCESPADTRTAIRERDGENDAGHP
jgi:hypothetical protein